MTEEIQVSRAGQLGIIELNRPRAINALTVAMFEAIEKTLVTWRDDASVRAVLFRGAGEKGFCAGGDVRATRDLMLAERFEDAARFFDLEYRVDGLIATYPKPIVAFQDGIVMGGGIGLSGHARFRIATERSRFAMPEAAIGFFCDVGSNFILSRQPRHRALAFEFAGEPVGAADAVMLRLTDIVVASSSLDALTDEIALAAADEDPEHAIAGVLTPHAGDIGPIPFCEGVDRLALCFEGDDVGQMLDALSARAAENEFAGHLADTISKRCPTSLVANLQALDASRTMKTAGEVLALDYRLAVYLTRRGDSAEGVRAVLVDKDHAPAWSPANLSAVDRGGIAAAIAGD